MSGRFSLSSWTPHSDSRYLDKLSLQNTSFHIIDRTIFVLLFQTQTASLRSDSGSWRAVFAHCSKNFFTRNLQHVLLISSLLFYLFIFLYTIPIFFRMLKKHVEHFLYRFDSISVRSMNSFPYNIPGGRGLEVGRDKNSFRILNPALASHPGPHITVFPLEGRVTIVCQCA